MGLFTDHLGNLADAYGDLPDPGARPEETVHTLTSLMETARNLEEDQREDFLAAAAMADKDLGSLMDMTDRLAGGTKSAFLSAAAASKEHIGDFIDASENLLMDDKINFAKGVALRGRGPLNLVDEAEGGHILTHTNPAGFTDFLASAEYMGSKMGDWLKGYL